jgi:capsular exopolysaccharide synthesis family protein
VQAQIDDIEETLRVEKANLVRRIQNEYEAALRQERLLSEGYQQQSRTVVGKIDKAAEYAALRREAEMARESYDALLQQMNRATVVSAVPTNNLRVIDPAVPAGEPSKPKPVQNITFGAFVCGALVFGLAYFREYRRLNRLSMVFASPGHTSDLLQLPELGVIPSVGPVPVRRLALFRRAMSGDLNLRVNGNGKGKGGGADTSLGLATWRSKPSALAESFRYTLTSLLGGRNDQWRPLIVVTSAGPGEGKTTIASNLAIAMAETGRRVLLVDADLRKARLHKIFKTTEGRGLADLLLDNEVEEPALLDYIRSTEVPGLSLLARGSQALEAASQYFFSRKISWLLRTLQREFDAVLIDSAPALSLPDARLLGRLSDGVVLVVRAGATHRKAVLTLRRQFACDGIPVLGTILNDWNPETTDNYYQAEYQVHEGL